MRDRPLMEPVGGGARPGRGVPRMAFGRSGTARAFRGVRRAAVRAGCCLSRLAVLVAAGLVLVGPVRAQTYPARPVRVIVANSAGSLADVVARVLFAKLSEQLGQSFLIDNRPGAGGAIAGDLAARAAPDGYTLLYASDATMSIAPYLYKSLSYDPQRDFAPVSMVAKIPSALVVHPSLGVRSMQAFIALARARPGAINYASGGPGHSTHLGMALVLLKAGIDLAHVPYKGTGPATQAVLTGEAGAAELGLGLVLPYIQDGRLIALGIAGPRAEGVLPAVPDLGQVLPGADYVAWQAVFLPGHAPPALVATLNADLARAMAAPDVAARVLDTGMLVAPGTPESLASVVHHDLQVNADLVSRLGLKAD
jgi:tripartite-type tricarboxylate transporter receptor subunit TctC